ncbi:dinitrogenase iron-molybdenum cofactor N-terminal domain-containing protein [Lyngbya sp. CCY1209]|uniref:dinitrogenase iron-molybdenum cofactor N-terminal domain-containing protein n=1 Tax=Lyngbya sp. CCY1209 TaxID=2886103 RepID=UPI002D20AD3E|nr:dinitrogenase iron-molybdenum cofactor N-terminal domain-containing protein [Lyngbya sp. CCY1209]MEB3885778.1 dinitrogenase iron-molybdenum cofactor biosynthesis protein [Lyngbya sp. CCY1209]
MIRRQVSENIAFRIALAARSLPGVSVRDLRTALQNILGGEFDECHLSQVTATHLETAFRGTYNWDGTSHSIPLSTLKTATQILWGEIQDLDQLLPAVEPYRDGEMSNSIRVAIASNTDELLDGHFGFCLRYLIYQVSATRLKLIDIRPAESADSFEDRNAFRMDLIRDCHALYALSLGSSVAEKLTQANIYPVKKLHGGNARDLLANLQKAIVTAPPPWLAKVLGGEFSVSFSPSPPTPLPILGEGSH